MQKESLEKQIDLLNIAEAKTRERLRSLLDRVAGVPGSHSPGHPTEELMRIEREIQTTVLELVDIDRQRQYLTVALAG